jgi:gamma-glutamyltranspeptidase/glutathione hydrolase
LQSREMNYSIPAPSSGGITLIEALNILEGFELSGLKHNGTDFIHIVAEVLKLAYADRARYIGDPQFVEVPTVTLTAKRFADVRRGSISPDQVGERVAPGTIDAHEGGSTTHFTVIDKDGNVVAATESIECYFGSGVMVPKVGIIMNDEMHDFDPLPGRINSIAPGKRPRSSMAPTIVLKDDSLILSLGSSGGPRIITAVLQVLLNVVDFGMPLIKAVAAPRFHCQESTLSLEGGILQKTQAGLIQRGHSVERKPKLDLFFGGVQAIQIYEGGITGMADPRRDGTAMGI